MTQTQNLIKDFRDKHNRESANSFPYDGRNAIDEDFIKELVDHLNAISDSQIWNSRTYIEHSIYYIESDFTSRFFEVSFNATKAEVIEAFNSFDIQNTLYTVYCHRDQLIYESQQLGNRVGAQNIIANYVKDQLSLAIDKVIEDSNIYEIPCIDLCGHMSRLCNVYLHNIRGCHVAYNYYARQFILYILDTKETYGGYGYPPGYGTEKLINRVAELSANKQLNLETYSDELEALCKVAIQLHNYFSGLVDVDLDVNTKTINLYISTPHGFTIYGMVKCCNCDDGSKWLNVLVNSEVTQYVRFTFDGYKEVFSHPLSGKFLKDLKYQAQIIQN